MFHTIIQNTIQSYQQLIHQMDIVVDFLGGPSDVSCADNQISVEQSSPRIVKGNQTQNDP